MKILQHIKIIHAGQADTERHPNTTASISLCRPDDTGHRSPVSRTVVQRGRIIRCSTIAEVQGCVIVSAQIRVRGLYAVVIYGNLYALTLKFIPDAPDVSNHRKVELRGEQRV